MSCAGEVPSMASADQLPLLAKEILNRRGRALDFGELAVLGVSIGAQHHDPANATWGGPSSNVRDHGPLRHVLLVRVELVPHHFTPPCTGSARQQDCRSSIL